MRKYLFVISILLVLCQPVFATYIEEELCIINWGNGENEFIVEPWGIDDAETPMDSTDDHTLGGGGPRHAFVDVYGNIIFTSSKYQLKGFDSGGGLLFDYSADSPDFIPGMFKSTMADLYVDNDKNIYFTTGWRTPYVPKINYEYHTLDNLRPFPESPDEVIECLNWAYDGKTMYFSENLGWITHDGSNQTAGGTWEVLLGNGRNYGATHLNADTIRFFSTVNPDIWGHGQDIIRDTVILGEENVDWVGLLKSMEPTHLYLQVSFFTDIIYDEIWIFDLEYNLIDRIRPPAEPDYYSSTPKPFITANGDVYEFRCREDGLHVIRWTKQ